MSLKSILSSIIIIVGESARQFCCNCCWLAYNRLLCNSYWIILGYDVGLLLYNGVRQTITWFLECFSLNESVRRSFFALASKSNLPERQHLTSHRLKEWGSLMVIGRDYRTYKLHSFSSVRTSYWLGLKLNPFLYIIFLRFEAESVLKRCS